MVEEDQGASARDYGFLMFLTLLNVMNFVDRQLLASFANWIVPDLGLTNTQFGLLTGLIFIFFYSVAGVFMGVLADRVNRTRLIAAGLALWSALTALSGMAKGFVSLAIPRLFIGVGESIMTPTAMSLLAGPISLQSSGFRLRRVLHGRAHWRRDEPVCRCLLGTGTGLAWMLLCVGWPGFGARGDHVFYERNASAS
jgi:MFS family permease